MHPFWKASMQKSTSNPRVLSYVFFSYDDEQLIMDYNYNYKAANNPKCR